MKTIIPREITEKEASFEFTPEEEFTEVRGNALACGDDDEDKACEDEILERLNRGDIYAWFCAKVTATWEGFEGVAYLGCCSYRNEKDFIDNEFKWMKEEALADLNQQIAAMAKKVSKAL